MLHRLADIEDSQRLSGFELLEKHEAMSSLHRFSKIEDKLYHHNSIMKWLRERDCNSNFFHHCVARCRGINTIHSILVDGACLDGVDDVKQAFQNHFQSMFAQKHSINVITNDLDFKRLSYSDCHILDETFDEAEIREAV
jgi:hypothetical protein